MKVEETISAEGGFDVDAFVEAIKESHKTHCDNLDSVMHELRASERFVVNEIVGQHKYLAERIIHLAQTLGSKSNE